MRHFILLAGLLTATPALADDCPEQEDHAVFQLDSLVGVWQRLQGLVRTSNVSNGLDHTNRDRSRVTKTPHTVQPTRDAECPPAGGMPGISNLLDKVFE